MHKNSNKAFSQKWKRVFCQNSNRACSHTEIQTGFEQNRNSERALIQAKI
jgi:hypothetical protein